MRNLFSWTGNKARSGLPREVPPSPSAAKHRIERIKLYGERNTGTTFTTQLIRNNFHIPMMYGTPDRPNRADREKRMQAFAEQPLFIRRLILDRIGDEENRSTLRETLGWKHM